MIQHGGVVQVRSVLSPQFQKCSAVSVFLILPVERITAQRIGDFFPKKRRVLSRRRLAGIEEGRAGAPRDRGWNLTAFVGSDDFVKLLEPLQTEDYHEGIRQLRAPRRGGVLRHFIQGQVERK